MAEQIRRIFEYELICKFLKLQQYKQVFSTAPTQYTFSIYPKYALVFFGINTIIVFFF